ncbi:MAG TPA: hypothetical protein VFG42_24730 [Baekduia sp.]|uniref:hypothetical protein n=1 Tax=Baekduia sp. TaxID=2600305 RepID=UPI002D7A0D01|nr:hypothetical protein [Baekduia sp.]HET6510023.1 hypothetical protein [Baekduia sp.]
MSGSTLSASGVVLAAIVFVVLFAILGVTLWVSIVAAVAALLLWAGIGGAGRVHAQHGHGAPGHG